MVVADVARRRRRWPFGCRSRRRRASVGIRVTDDGWSLLAAKMTPDLEHATFTVDHLSWFRALWLNAKDAVTELKTQSFDGMTSGAFSQAGKPQCANENQARADGYSISSSAKETVYWRFGIEGGARTLKIVNRRAGSAGLRVLPERVGRSERRLLLCLTRSQLPCRSSDLISPRTTLDAWRQGWPACWAA